MRTRLCAASIIFGSLLLAVFASAQQAPRDLGKVPVPEMTAEMASIRKQAMEFYQQRKFAEAIPLLQKVLAEVPQDAVAQERYAIAIFELSCQLTDPAQKKTERIRARKEFLRAKELGKAAGVNSDITETMLASIPEDGSEAAFSQNAEVEQWMQKAERAFSARNLPEAEEAYKQALKRAPKLYAAALFLGDVHALTKECDEAGEWFQRAISIDPQRETAYRYWGDTLLKEGKVTSARQKFIEAVLASPYDQRAWSGINNYLRAVNKGARFPRIQPPVKMTETSPGNMTMSLAPQPELQSEMWVGYPVVRATWPGGNFAKEYPNEKEYRHSLKEEVAALSAVVDVAQKSAKDGKKLNEQLSFLVEVHKAGLLEPYVLLNVPDQGIAKDYPPYKKDHLDLLVRYLNEIVLPAALPDAK